MIDFYFCREILFITITYCKVSDWLPFSISVILAAQILVAPTLGTFSEDWCLW